jgi:hypothetical protein
MTTQMTRGMLAARALALVIAAIGITLDPNGVAGATSTRGPEATEGLSRAGEVRVLHSHVGDRRAVACDDGSDSGDGGDGDDGGDDE